MKFAFLLTVTHIINFTKHTFLAQCFAGSNFKECYGNM